MNTWKELIAQIHQEVNEYRMMRNLPPIAFKDIDPNPPKKVLSLLDFRGRSRTEREILREQALSMLERGLSVRQVVLNTGLARCTVNRYREEILCQKR